jgi:hypothetical protein
MRLSVSYSPAIDNAPECKMNTAAQRDFSAKTHKALAAKGIKMLSTQAIPGAGEMPWANASRGYFVDDNGTGKVWTHEQVLEAA